MLISPTLQGEILEWNSIDFAYFTVGETISSARVSGLAYVPCTRILANRGKLRHITGHSVQKRRTSWHKLELKEQLIKMGHTDFLCLGDTLDRLTLRWKIKILRFKWKTLDEFGRQRQTDQGQPQWGLTMRKYVNAQTLTSGYELLVCLLIYGDTLTRGTSQIAAQKMKYEGYE